MSPEAELVARSTLDSLSAHIAIVDESGTIVATNKAWRDFAEANGIAGQNYAEGANYLQVCDSAAGPYSEEAAPFAEGIRSVLGNRCEKFELEYPCHSPSEQRWFMGRVTRFPAGGPPRVVVAHENITKRKLAEVALRESEERFRSLAQNASDIVTILEADGTVRYVSPAVERVLGYRPEEMIGKNGFDYIYQGDSEEAASTLARILSEPGVQAPFEFRVPHKDGSSRHLEIAVNNLLDNPSIGAIVLNSRDVTERKRAEEKIIFQARLLDTVGQAVIATDLQGQITYWNRFAEELYGWSAQEVMGRSVMEVTPSEDQLEQAEEIMAELRAGRGWSGEFVVRRKDGTPFPVMVTDTPVHDEQGNLVGIIGVSTDITERKQVEEERAQLLLREQAARAEAEAAQARLAAILNNLTEGVLMADPQGHILFANPAARAMLGKTSAEPLEELPDPWGDFHLPEAVAHCAKSGESVEARVRYGETFLRVKLEFLDAFDSNLGDVLVVMQDLSEGHRLEANQQRFLANAAHQLKTPIMAILGAAELLATGDDADPTIRGPLLNHIFGESRRMQRLSETLLRLSRIGWDRREPNLEIVDLSEAGQQATERMAPLAENMGLRVLVKGETAYVRADPEWLQEVLLVLLSNAIKHSNRGGDVRVRVAGNTLTVEDEGAGISPADLPHVFERFYRGKDSSEGFGLGLSICRELTERMGGSISIRSREGIGTAVKIELPEVEADA